MTFDGLIQLRFQQKSQLHFTSNIYGYLSISDEIWNLRREFKKPLESIVRTNRQLGEAQNRNGFLMDTKWNFPVADAELWQTNFIIFFLLYLVDDFTNLHLLKL